MRLTVKTNDIKMVIRNIRKKVDDFVGLVRSVRLCECSVDGAPPATEHRVSQFQLWIESSYGGSLPQE
jgi:hypothetical protein